MTGFLVRRKTLKLSGAMVYFDFCLGKSLVVFYIILETKLFALDGCYFWSLLALGNYI